MNTQPTNKEQEAFLAETRQMVFEFRKTRILFTAFELDIFTHLDDKALQAEDVAKKCGTDARATTRLMNALTALGYLEKEGDYFKNTPVTGKFLVKGKPSFFGGMMHSANLFNSWNTLTEAVKAGTTVIKREKNFNNEKWTRAFINAMHARAKNLAPEVAGKLDLQNVHKVLDIGGGSGIFSMAVTDRGKNIQATVFDLPNVIPITREFIEKEGYTEKIDTREGSFREKLPDEAYDMVLLSAIIHMNSFEQNNDLIEKCSRVLKPGGQLVIQDFIMNDSRTEPQSGALFALNMLVGTEAGDTYTEAEISSWFLHNGIETHKRIAMKNGSSLLIGRKIAK